jgi:perosamine synthetase
MSRTILTAIAPNAERDDVLLALRLLLWPKLWLRGKSAEKLEAWFCNALSVKHAVSFESGRAALLNLLAVFGVRDGDEVLVPAFTCVAVPNAAHWNGAHPVYVDCHEGTMNMNAKEMERHITSRTKAVIVQYTFGNTQGIEDVLHVARLHRLVIIEDCAHALGTRMNGRLVGTFGDGAIFSTGRDKCVSSVSGGIAVTNNDSAALRLRDIRAHCGPMRKRWVMQQLLHVPITAVARTLYDVGSLGKVIMVVARKFRLITLAVEPKEKHGKRVRLRVGYELPEALALLALHQLTKLDRFIVHRAALAATYDALLKDVPQVHRPVFVGEGAHGWLRYTVRVSGRDTILRRTKARRVYLGDWYTAPIAPQGVDYERLGYHVGSCPVAERLANECLNLPTDIHMTEHDAARVVHALKESL